MNVVWMIGSLDYDHSMQMMLIPGITGACIFYLKSLIHIKDNFQMPYNTI